MKVNKFEFINALEKSNSLDQKVIFGSLNFLKRQAYTNG